MKIRSDDEYYEPKPWSMGSAHAVSNDAEQGDEAVRLLHEAVKEVTGTGVEPLAKRRIGFLP
jgi:hypothetical protein